MAEKKNTSKEVESKAQEVESKAQEVESKAQEVDQYRAKANEMIKAHDLEVIYLTSDGQGFTDLSKAENHSVYLKDKRIFEFFKQ